MTLTRRELLAAASGMVLPSSIAHADRSDNGKARLMQGPMLGAVEPDRIRIWARASEECALRLEVSTAPDFDRIVAHATERAGAGQDFSAVMTADGLAPSAAYFYRVLVNGSPDPYVRGPRGFAAHTAPRAGSTHSFSVAFGSCARYALDPVQQVWTAVSAHSPDLFLWLGDNVYGDSRNPAALAEEYRRQREVVTFQPLARCVPQLAIWDDHDYGLNNHDRSNPMRDTALGAFRRYWANPAYGTASTPGVFFRYSYGAVDFFMLDGRYYRDANDAADTPGKTLLGSAQLQWLKHELSASRAVFKVLACGSGWTKAKGPGGDSWASFLHERDALFDFVRNNDVGGVVLLSGDTHVGELNAIPWSARGGYDLYELVSSPLAQPCEDSWLDRSPELRIRPVYAASANFGLLRCNFSGEPRLEYELIDSSGRPVLQPLTLSASDLRNGQVSWRRLIHPSLMPA